MSSCHPHLLTSLHAYDHLHWVDFILNLAKTDVSYTTLPASVDYAVLEPVPGHDEADNILALEGLDVKNR